AVLERARLLPQPWLPARDDGPAPCPLPEALGAVRLRDDSHAARALLPAGRCARTAPGPGHARCGRGTRRRGTLPATRPALGGLIFCHIKARFGDDRRLPWTLVTDHRVDGDEQLAGDGGERGFLRLPPADRPLVEEPHRRIPARGGLRREKEYGPGIA